MHEFSGIRATARPKRDEHERDRARPRVRAALLAALLVAPGILGPAAPAAASDHAAPADAHGAAPTAAPPAAPTPPPPPPPRPRPPPPKLDGPVAAPEPKPRLTFLADRTTGLALGGHDPVAYFLDGRPTLGLQSHEVDWGGTTWRFADEGSATAFRDAPAVYAPLYGGRCAFAVSNGRPTEGSPQHFVIHRGRLLLFADVASRAAFLTDPDRVFAEAERRWPALLADLP